MSTILMIMESLMSLVITNKNHIINNKLTRKNQMKKEILIVTKFNDTHGRIIELALKQKGHNVTRWIGGMYPLYQTGSMHLSSDKGIDSWSCEEEDKQIGGKQYDTVWFRRPEMPRVPKTLHEDDVEFARFEYIYHNTSVLLNICPDAYWVNSFKTRSLADSKITQLDEATKCGLTIPPTLVSNNSKDIEKFVEEHIDSDIIHKCFTPFRWEENEKIILTRTTVFNKALLKNVEMLQSTPGIYQPLIKKEYEIRATFFGAYPVAVKINTQHHKEGSIDWRDAPHTEKNTSIVELPPSLIKKCHKLMKKLNIEFACFDFIVTLDGDYIFLEFNEMGQFLWLEEHLPEVPFLDIFCEFLISGTFDFEYKKINPISMSSVVESSAYESLTMIDEKANEKLMRDTIK